MGPKSKMNCWEFRSCGRQPGGEAADLGPCPAATEASLDGVNGGTNGGRCCWTVAGTFCFGTVSGTMAAKFANCLECEFFWRVADEEDAFTPSLGFVTRPGRKT